MNAMKMLSAQLLSTVAPVASTSGIRDEDRANTSDPNARAPKAPKGKAGKVDRMTDATWRKKQAQAHMSDVDDALASLKRVCDDAQLAAIETLAADALERQAQELDWNALMDTHVAAIAGKGKMTGARYFVIVAAFRTLIGPYAASCFRNAVKRRDGKLPTKGDARATGTIKGYSPKKWLRGIASSVDELAERAAKVASIKNDINGAVLREFLDALRQLERAEKSLAKAIGE